MTHEQEPELSCDPLETTYSLTLMSYISMWRLLKLLSLVLLFKSASVTGDIYPDIPDDMSGAGGLVELIQPGNGP